MKNKNIKIGLVAALGGMAAMQDCHFQAGRTVATNDKSVDSIRLEQQLRELAKTEYKGKLTPGAMCYMMMFDKFVDWVCPYCGDTTKWEYGTWVFSSIDYIEEIVSRIKTLGYDVVLDKAEFCSNCSNHSIEKPELIFKIRFSTKADYYIVKSNIVDEYQCLLAFLSNKKKFKGTHDEEHALHDNIAIIQKMTGLGKDLKIEKQ